MPSNDIYPKAVHLRFLETFINAVNEKLTDKLDVLFITPFGYVKGQITEIIDNFENAATVSNDNIKLDISTICKQTNDYITKALEEDSTINILSPARTIYLTNVSLYPNNLSDTCDNFEQFIITSDQIIGYTLINSDINKSINITEI